MREAIYCLCSLKCAKFQNQNIYMIEQVSVSLRRNLIGAETGVLCVRLSFSMNVPYLGKTNFPQPFSWLCRFVTFRSLTTSKYLQRTEAF
jgi:hypothetical protein